MALAEELEKQIVSGEFKVGDKFPSERKLVKTSGLSLLTVRQSLMRLEKKGLIIRRQGAGSFVTSREPIAERIWVSVVVMSFDTEMSAGYQFIYSAWMHGVSRVADKAGVQLSMVDLGIFKDPRERLDEMSRQEKGPSGWLFSQVHSWMLDYLVGSESRLPMKHGIIADKLMDGRLNVATVDFAGAAAEAAAKFYALGHRRMAYIGSFGNLRHEGWMNGLKNLGIYEQNADLIVPDPVPVYTLIVAEENGYVAGKELLRRQNRPTAIFCTNDSRAIGVLRAAQELGVKVPEELSVIGFDNIPGSEHLKPPLATFSPPWEDVGEAAMKLLLSWLEKGNRYKPQTKTLKIPFIERESLGKAVPTAAAAEK
jgi:DNA-binding LacI/PurR family transcriptional regulator